MGGRDDGRSTRRMIIIGIMREQPQVRFGIEPLSGVNCRDGLPLELGLKEWVRRK